MLAVTRYHVDPADAAAFEERARDALGALAARDGCREGRVGRAVDDGRLWVLQTVWESVGAYRRALSHPDVKVRAVPVMYLAVDEPSAYEDLLTWSPGRGLSRHETARAPDADVAGPGRDTLGDLS